MSQNTEMLFLLTSLSPSITYTTTTIIIIIIDLLNQMECCTAHAVYSVSCWNWESIELMTWMLQDAVVLPTESHNTAK